MRIERRLTIDELAERLALSRSTIYYWVRDLPIPGSGPGGGWPQSAHRAAGRAIKRKYRLLREAAYEEGLESFDELSIDPTFRDFVCLYIAEGYKRDRNSVAICNSDGAVLVLALYWIRRLTGKLPEFSISTTPIRTLTSSTHSGASCSASAPKRFAFNASRTAVSLRGVRGAAGMVC